MKSTTYVCPPASSMGKVEAPKLLITLALPASVALATNQGVVGSIPASRTIKGNEIKGLESDL